ncbi:LOW QUALITY PROTEIN: uncharacterized protein lrrc69 [Pholidichthys leucotaenia]
MYHYRLQPNLNGIKIVPKCVNRLTNLLVLLLNNSISDLPTRLLWLLCLCLHQLAVLNLGDNTLKNFPAVGHLESLTKLYLFRNQITTVPPDVMVGDPFDFLVCSLSNLQHLSVLDNALMEIPAEISHLTRLSQINLINKLTQLPQQLYQCKDLTKLYAARNKLTSLPECHLLTLKEFYCEGNKFIKCKTVSSVKDAEMFSLKKLVARFVLHENRNKFSLVHIMLHRYPHLAAPLASANYCVICLNTFLTTWMECVHFKNLKKDMKMRSLLTILACALLCSYKCFSTKGHCYNSVGSR